MFASLPMYDRAETRAAQDALWAMVRDSLGFGPPHLDRKTPYIEGWARPDLVLGQICNLPYRASFRGRVARIGCADYGLPDTPPGYYHSVFVVRGEDAMRGLAPATLGRFAFNDALSHSGWGAPVAHVTAMGLRFHTTFRTGAHVESALAVAQGRADLASIDAITWRMMEAWEPQVANLRVIARTRVSPGMTFITGLDHDADQIRAALQDAIAQLPDDHRATLGIRGLHVLGDSAYDIPLPPAP